MRQWIRRSALLVLCGVTCLLFGAVGNKSVSAESPSISGDEARPFLLQYDDDDDTPDPNLVTIPPEVREAVKKGLDWLVSKQGADGLWTEAGTYTLPISCMAGLAIASWAGPGSGPKPYRDAIKRLTNFILECADPKTGYIFYNNSAAAQYGDDRPAYGHAYGLLFLTQVYGMAFTPEEQARIREVIIKAVRFLEEHQDRTGCWYQDYRGGHNDLVTPSHIEALRAAKFSGFSVSKATIKRALEYNGKMISGGGSSGGRNSAYVAVQLAGGDYASFTTKQGALRVLEACKNASYYQMDKISFANFTHLYSAQVCFFVGGTHWKNYYANLSKWYLAHQQASGSWPKYQNVHAVQPSEAYSTAVACLLLQIPNRYLPFYEAIEPGEISKSILDEPGTP